MDGLAFVQMVERELKRRGIPKELFYKESGISSATMSQWRKRIYSPSSAAIRKIEEYLGVVFSIEQKENAPTETDERIDMSDVDVAFYGDYKELSDDDQKTIRDMVRVMRERRANRDK